ncbi:MAG: ABC transporter ATP-binding protein [Betaproteobacteria bacterium]|jgi:putative ABC transport system ATP-binding protein
MSIVVLEHVTKEYRLGEHMVCALSDVSLTIEKGVFLAIAGPSGSGKSTLLNIIGCIDTASKGRVHIAGHDVSGRTPDQLASLRARTIGFVFQTFNLLPVLTAEENVEYPLLQMGELDREDRRERVQQMLGLVQLSKFSKHRPNQLSGGQRQRVAIARALVTRPELVLADEPTANLDHKTGEGILALMREINRKLRTTFIFSTHDKKVIDAADRLIGIEDGTVRVLGVRREGQWALTHLGKRVDPNATQHNLMATQTNLMATQTNLRATQPDPAATQPKRKV